MKHQQAPLLILMLFLLAVSACGGGESQSAGESGAEDSQTQRSTADGNIYRHPPGKNHRGFELNVFNTDGEPVPNQLDHFELKAKQIEDGRELWIYLKDASRRKAVYFTVEYDRQKEHPVSTVYGDALSDSYQFSTYRIPGIAAVGQIVRGYPEADGVNVDRALLARLRFKDGPHPAVRSGTERATSARGVSQIVSQNNPIPQDLSVSNNSLNFTAKFRGDLNGDGISDFSDITEVINNFGLDANQAPEASDANQDGVVDFSDITFILNIFGIQVNEFQVWTADAESDLDASNIESNATQVGQAVGFSEGVVNTQTQFRDFQVDLQPLMGDLRQFVTIQPVGTRPGTGSTSGPPSAPLALQLAPPISEFSLTWTEEGAETMTSETEPENMGRFLIHERNLDGVENNAPEWTVYELNARAIGTKDGNSGVNVTSDVFWVVEGDFIATPFVIDPGTGEAIDPESGNPIDREEEAPVFEIVDEQGMTDDPADDSLVIKGRRTGQAEISAFVPISRTESSDTSNGSAELVASVNAVLDVDITTGGSTDDQSVTPGNPVQFNATGLAYERFDPDTGQINIGPNDPPPIQNIDLTNDVVWQLGAGDPPEAVNDFAITTGGELRTGDAALSSGDSVQVYADYPKFGELGDDGEIRPLKLFGGFSPTSNSISVTLE